MDGRESGGNPKIKSRIPLRSMRAIALPHFSA
jgi:hypothetical protein